MVGLDSHVCVSACMCLCISSLLLSRPLALVCALPLSRARALSGSLSLTLSHPRAASALLAPGPQGASAAFSQVLKQPKARSGGLLDKYMVPERSLSSRFSDSGSN